jgi:hypothetical protein
MLDNLYSVDTFKSMRKVPKPCYLSVPIWSCSSLTWLLSVSVMTIFLLLPLHSLHFWAEHTHLGLFVHLWPFLICFCLFVWHWGIKSRVSCILDNCSLSYNLALLFFFFFKHLKIFIHLFTCAYIVWVISVSPPPAPFPLISRQVLFCPYH